MDDTFYAALFALVMAVVISVSGFRLGMLHQKKISDTEDDTTLCVVDIKNCKRVLITPKDPFDLKKCGKAKEEK